ncbi:hypothetical protein K431DRAFT_2094 [Polychaeton citri CBS 116435]|uniref:Uncharacterized protein n=1 Tax=Polychaeton citri CBS 116435 TaxID=1314669 RepID=A0A9P4UVF5_9PEZI|nr:hypothetical protein K431DRAFT_2094 [Polychaeton citri CBS 116435]
MEVTSSEQVRSKYDEEEIVGLISSIYELLLELGHMKEEAVDWAPPEGHTLDLSNIPDGVDVDPRVLSLMSRLPLPKSEPFVIQHRMNNFDYRDPIILAESRDFDRWLHPSGLDVSNAAPTMLMLLAGRYADDPCLILDVEDNTIRTVQNRWLRVMPWPATAHEQPDQRFYTFWPPVDAVQYLDQAFQRLLRADEIPMGQYAGFVVVELEPQFQELKRVLVEEYGWPYNFRRADWLRNRSSQYDRIRAESRFPIDDHHEPAW